MFENNGGEERLAPVIPLFGGRTGDAERNVDRNSEPRALRAMDIGQDAPIPVARTHPAAGGHAFDGGLAENDPDDVRRRGEEALVRKLRAKQLSVSEARMVLRQHDVDAEGIESILDEFQHRGYLDDRTLASLLVTTGVERKGQGRVVLSRSLAQRGVPREIVDEVLAELPDDDAERALEFARAKARAMTDLEPDTALRRLLGQLARRGYGGSAAMEAARTALREAGSGRGRVRFVDSD